MRKGFWTTAENQCNGLIGLEADSATREPPETPARGEALLLLLSPIYLLILLQVQDPQASHPTQFTFSCAADLCKGDHSYLSALR